MENVGARMEEDMEEIQQNIEGEMTDASRLRMMLCTQLHHLTCWA